MLARRILCIPATSAPSERVFSVAGQVVTAKRNRLHCASVALLVWLRAAWQFFEERAMRAR
jgi:shikimate kinase